MKRAEPKPKKSAAQKLWAWIKFIALVIFVALLILAFGFFVFAEKVDGLSTPKVAPDADGIVVWTGPGGGRLEAGAALLKQGKGERLLISGVNRDLKSQTIFNLLDLPEETKACCIDLDYVAEDTIGNARETAAWAKALGYEHILLVTSAYHMPRAQSEIALAAGRIRITAYPVSAEMRTHWYSDRDRFDRLLSEYAKLLVTMARGSSKSQREKAPDTPLPQTEPQN
jgi:uncharacterized SAM-binding protein YcdF (DUF218 family)